ncbi:MAG: twin-arginine translocase TatA/TatE family subunit [Bacteriovoracia bacterium]
MFGISGSHLIILGIVLLILGPRRLPEVGHSLGKAMKNFKDALAGVAEPPFKKLDDTAHTAASESAPSPKDPPTQA